MRDASPDYLLLAITGILVVLGILVLASVSPFFSLQRFHNSYYFLFHQVGLGLVPGVILGFLAFRLDLGILKKLAPSLLFFNLIAMALIFVPEIGTIFRGARRWLSLGKVSLQPAEFLKLTFVLYLAVWLSSRTENKKTKKSARIPVGQKNKKTKLLLGRSSADKHFSETLLAFLIIIGIISLFLIFQPDISTLSITLFVAGLLYFAADTPFWQIISVLTAVGLGITILIQLAPYRLARLLVFLRPETDPMGIGYQIKQAVIGIGSGGIFGLGLGMSQQKFGFLPFPMSDSVFAIFAEETGFLGGFLLVCLFLLFAWQGFKIARRAQDKFRQLSALGITSWLTLQAFINIGAMLGILPLAGVPLPFISYGGSALIVELIGVGILLNISKQTT